MQNRQQRIVNYSFLFAVVLLLGVTYMHTRMHARKHFQPNSAEVQYTENLSGQLNVFLYCHSSDYFLYKGTPLGFQYELLKKMSDSLEIKLNFTYSNDPEEIKTSLYSSRYDIIAMDIYPSLYGDSPLTFSLPHSTSYAVRIKRKKEVAPCDTLWVSTYFPGSLYAERYTIIKVDTADSEELFEALQNKRIHALCTDYNTAITLLPFYPELTLADTVGPTYERQWILNPANRSLNAQINAWLASYRQSKDYEQLCDKYFHPKSRFLAHASVEKRKGRISSYDAFIKREAQKYGVDWRLVSSIIYQESRFTTESIGMGGSFGIMQLMPTTAASFGIDSTASVEEQIVAGIRLIASINKQFLDITDENERAYFITASYNAGAGHIHDARKLCEKYGENSYKWHDVEKYLALKTDRQYYTDPVVNNGYYPGKHTIRYTHAVIDRYNGYKMSIP